MTFTISKEKRYIFRMNYQTDHPLLSSDFWLYMFVGCLLWKCSFPEPHPNPHPAPTLVGGMTISHYTVLPVTRDNNETFIESYST